MRSTILVIMLGIGCNSDKPDKLVVPPMPTPAQQQAMHDQQFPYGACQEKWHDLIDKIQSCPAIDHTTKAMRAGDGAFYGSFYGSFGSNGSSGDRAYAEGACTGKVAELEAALPASCK